MQLEIDLFIQDLRKKCRESGIKLILARSKAVWLNVDMKCAGYFDHIDKHLVVARNDPRWLEVIVHEASHLDQYIEQCEIWKKEEKNGTSVFDRWIRGKSVVSIRKSFNNMLMLELDCEKRALDKIAKFDLPINSVNYIRRANAILLYYRYAYEKGEWSNELIKDTSRFPSRFMHDSYYKKKLTKRIRQIFLDEGL